MNTWTEMEFRLRPWKRYDANSLVKYAGNPKITQFMSDGFANVSTPEGARKFIEFANSGSDKLYYAIDIGGEAVGGIGISVQSDIYRKDAELGYWLAEPFWGRGIISKAIPLIIAEAFKTLGIDRIFAKPFHTNTASHHVLEESGFQRETILGKTVLKKGEYLDEYIYAIRK